MSVCLCLCVFGSTKNDVFRPIQHQLVKQISSPTVGVRTLAVWRPVDVDFFFCSTVKDRVVVEQLHSVPANKSSHISTNICIKICWGASFFCWFWSRVQQQNIQNDVTECIEPAACTSTSGAAATAKGQLNAGAEEFVDSAWIIFRVYRHNEVDTVPQQGSAQGFGKWNWLAQRSTWNREKDRERMGPWRDHKTLASFARAFSFNTHLLAHANMRNVAVMTSHLYDTKHSIAQITSGELKAMLIFKHVAYGVSCLRCGKAHVISRWYVRRRIMMSMIHRVVYLIMNACNVLWLPYYTIAVDFFTFFVEIVLWQRRETFVHAVHVPAYRQFIKIDSAVPPRKNRKKKTKWSSSSYVVVEEAMYICLLMHMHAVSVVRIGRLDSFSFSVFIIKFKFKFWNEIQRNTSINVWISFIAVCSAKNSQADGKSNKQTEHTIAV